MKFKLYDDEWDLNQLYQSVATTFALGYKNDGVIAQVHPFVKCRDYLNDIWFEDRLEIDLEEIYGFNLNTNDYPGITEDVNLFVKFECHGDFFNTFKKYMSLLRDFEKSCGLSPTRTYKVPDTSIGFSSDTYQVVLLKIDSKWYSSPATMSLYTFLIRIITSFIHADVSSTSPKDFLQLLSFAEESSVKGRIDAINEWIDLPYFVSHMDSLFNSSSFMRSVNNTLESVISEGEISNIHDGSGFFSFLFCFTPYVDGWAYEDEDASTFMDYAETNEDVARSLYERAANRYKSLL